jgi:hypothetical protein
MEKDLKDLLLKDLSARLPYGVKIQTPTNCWTSEEDICELKEIFKGDDGLFRIGDVGVLMEYLKPYLFPLSSMTEEQLFEVQEILGKNEIKIEDGFLHIVDSDRNTITYLEILALLEWFYKNHFDIYGLIPMSLAIDATGLNIY